MFLGVLIGPGVLVALVQGCVCLCFYMCYLCSCVCLCCLFFVRGDAWAGIALPGGALVGFCSLFVGGLVVIVVFVYL